MVTNRHSVPEKILILFLIDGDSTVPFVHRLQGKCDCKYCSGRPRLIIQAA